MRSGDRIAVFNGVKMPFMFRDTGTKCSLIRPRYVEGLPNGEPAAMARRGEVDVSSTNRGCK
jgi:hypothetical protein